jgi:hypothetical protein
LLWVQRMKPMVLIARFRDHYDWLESLYGNVHIRRQSGSKKTHIECWELDIASRLQRLICETMTPVER